MGAMSLEGVIGALLFLGLGIAVLAFVNRSIYPSLRWRYEKAKTTQTHGLAPATIMALVKVQSLILLPLIGFMLGNGIASISG
jgi:ABC-type enterochelin transport system permease subunit